MKRIIVVAVVILLGLTGPVRAQNALSRNSVVQDESISDLSAKSVDETNTASKDYNEPIINCISDKPFEPIPYVPMKPYDVPLECFDEIASNQYSVGTPDGNLTVSDDGAAIYDLKIDVPDGGTLTPQIALSYNSRNSGYGLAGYGFNLTGLSVITRGTKDLFHDNKVQGVTYTSSDTYFLDGKRLILSTGTAGKNGASYTVEGDPFTVVTVHGDNGTDNSWFEVRTNTGMVYQYGNTSASKLSYKNKSGVPHVAAWYINRMEDKYGNYVTYDYTAANLQVRPRSITYGESRGIKNEISFTYQSLGDNARSFMVEDQKGAFDVCLASITTSCNNITYRQYIFTYDGTTDKSQVKYTRLVKVEEKNGKGESLPPVQFNWTFLPTSELVASQLNVPCKDEREGVEENDRYFWAIDLTGDGVSDIIRIVPITRRFGTQLDWRTCVYISRSKVTESGRISYDDPIIFDPTRNPFAVTGGLFVMDFDGDGYNDLVIPCNTCMYHVIRGCDVVEGRTDKIKNFTIPLQVKVEDAYPFYVIFDTDGDGKDDMFYVSNVSVDGYYPCGIVKFKDWEHTEQNQSEFKIKLDKEPEKLFTGDYNNDGLTDIILLYDGGYKIYYNNGGTADATKFTEANSKTGTNFGDYWRVQQGDFDGDGLLDFVYAKPYENTLQIAHNNGNGTFSIGQSVDIGVGDGGAPGDDTRFAIRVLDLDHDGLSDVMVCKAGYEYKNFPKYCYEYNNTQVKLLYSNGTNLVLKNSYTKFIEDDAKESTIFLGDFDGDGYMELANYGSVLNNTSSSFKERINVYRPKYDLSQAGKISSITDGFGNTEQIKYAYLTDPLVYKRTLASSYPVNTYTLPLSVVSKVTSSNGAAANQTKRYYYKDLKLHIGGRGMLGFNSIRIENMPAGVTVSKTITGWDQKRWIPTKIEETNAIEQTGGSFTEVYLNSAAPATSTSAYTIADVGNNYFTYLSQKEVTDFDGNTVKTTTDYDKEKGVIVNETVDNGGDMYKKVSYSGYIKTTGGWLPSALTMTQKHHDDNRLYETKTIYGYNVKGNVTSTTQNSGTELALTTVSTYDAWGNMTSSVTTGKRVTPVKKCYRYDSSGRFVVESTTEPASAVNKFTYDLWGNVLTESDATYPGNVLTARYTYDGWGRKLTALAADGTKTEYETGWGTSAGNKYYTKEMTANSPAVTVCYDSRGREVSQATTGAKGVSVSKTTTYNDKGEVSRIDNTTGKLTVTQTFEYDERGRVITDKLSSGRTTTYSYGNRTVTVTTAGRSHTKITDAWGNTVRTVDPIGGEVECVYSSVGKPKIVTAHGSAVEMTYDAAGNQISLTDPDAGESHYEYAADGTLLSQTDGRGVETTNFYDNLGRISSVRTGEKTITYEYGTSGNEKLRLIRQTTGGCAVVYEHDRFGRITKETRTIKDKGTYTFEYAYNGQNQLAKTTYPGGLAVEYQYDSNGFKTRTVAGNKVIYDVEKYDGLVSSTSFMGRLTATRTLDERGYEKNVNITRGSTVLDSFDESYDGATDNLLSRQRAGKVKESFGYDALDRLTSVKTGTVETMRIDYAGNGNIVSKTGVGGYRYGDSDHPHAVTEVENEDGEIPTDALTTDFNDFGKIEHIADAGTGYSMDFVYGPDQERWYSTLSKGTAKIRTTVYAGDYEIITENGVTREFYYLDGNTIVIRKNGVITPYIAFTDNLGSILSVMDENGTKVFDASYDAWGEQTVRCNTIGLHRGYTGHEMLSEFEIINMNGRLYDPVLGRFFSPDNYVQMPDNSQNFNRYSYCLNNPLKYTDPSGELWQILVAAAIVGGVVNLAANWDNCDGFWQCFTAFCVGAGSGLAVAAASITGASALAVGGVAAAGGAATSATNSVIAQTGTNFSGIEDVDWGEVGVNGAIGGASGFAGGAIGSTVGRSLSGIVINSVNITSPVAKGVVTGAVGGIIASSSSGFVGGYLSTGSLSMAGQYSMTGLWQGAVIGAVSGGISSYAAAKDAGINPWTGKYVKGAVIGESMDKRIIPVAKDLQADYLDAPQMEEAYFGHEISPNTTYTNRMSMEYNAKWIENKMNQGYHFYDLGPSGKTVSSPYYNMEQGRTMVYPYVHKTYYYNYDINSSIRLRLIIWK